MSMQAADQLRLARPAAHLRSASWFIRRTLFGVMAISVFVIGSACLLYAGIDPDDTAAMASDQSQSE